MTTRRMIKLNVMGEVQGRLRRLWFVMLLFLCMLLAATAAKAENNSYYYPNYDASANGCVDLMNYVQRVTVTANGNDYTLDQLTQMKQEGHPLTLKVGDTLSFNFLFNLQGRAYDPNDPTLLDTANSTYVTYTHGTTMLDGTTVAAGSQGILDDSSLMKENTSRGSSYLRMDIGWLLDSCPGSYNIEYTDGKVSFYQGGENNRYLYVYFPGGIGNDVYATSGYFTLTATMSRTLDQIKIPVISNFFGQKTDWVVDTVVSQEVGQNYTGNISTYGRISVKKTWITTSDHGPAKIVLTYTKNGQQCTATRTIYGDETVYFDIRQDMTNCVLSEDMTGLDDYVSNMTVSDDGKTYTFTNTHSIPLKISKKAATGTDELPGATLVLFSVGSDGSTTEIERWTSSDTQHETEVLPGDYLLRETVAPAGYAMSLDITFTVGTDGSIKMTSQNGSLDNGVLTVIDKQLEVKLAKVDPSGNCLPGAVLTLTDQNTGKLVHRWTSGTEPEKIVYAGNTGEVLVAGHTYVLHEETPPAGYQTAADVTFIFNGDGTIPDCGYHLVSMTDYPTPTPTPPSVTPTPPTSTPSIPGNGPSPTPFTPGGPSLPTGDSPIMWIFLALAVICLGGGIAVIAAGRRHKQSGAGDEPPIGGFDDE